MLLTFPAFLTWLSFACCLGCGLVAGAFYAFSSFVMAGLGRLPPAQGIAAMNSLNVTAVMPPFMLGIFGTAAACMVLAVVSARRWQQPGAGWAFAASLIYLLGAVGVTMFFNVPRNNDLATVSGSGAEDAALWSRYLVEWTAWNHVRMVAALVASGLLVVALKNQG